MRHAHLIAASLAGLAATMASANVSTTLNLATARASTGNGGSVLTNQTVGGRTGVWTLDRGGDPSGWANVWGYAGSGYSAYSNFGMQSSTYQGSYPDGWANGGGALLADVLGASFDYYIQSGSFSGGIRLSMYVYSPASAPGDEGYLQFDLGSLLPGQTAGQWYSTGNYLAAGSPINGAFYSAAYGSSQFGGQKSFQEILGLLSGWHVYGIGIINDTGNIISIDNFTVTSVPGPGAVALIGIAAAVGRRRRSA